MLMAFHSVNSTLSPSGSLDRLSSTHGTQPHGDSRVIHDKSLGQLRVCRHASGSQSVSLHSWGLCHPVRPQKGHRDGEHETAICRTGKSAAE